MDILLVSPPWTDDLGIFARIAKCRNSHPPLGILYLAAVAERRGHRVRVLDAETEGMTTGALALKIASFRPDLVGITATSPVFHKAVALAAALKDDGFTAPLLIGGEHINVFRKEAFADCFDVGFFGESDQGFDGFLELFENNKHSYASLKGVIFRKNGAVIETGPPSRVQNLDELPFPAMHLLDHAAYVMTFARFSKRRFLPIMASRGCPFKCSFCSEPLTNPTIRFRSPGNIADEMEKWHREFGTSHFFFVDSNLTLNREQITGVCNEIIRRKLDITFEGWTRVNLVDREILALMKKAGLIRMSYGIESGDEEVLRINKKEISREQILEAFKITAALGIEPASFLMLGLPGDTRASIERTIDFVKNIPQMMFTNFSIANPYPGTEMYEWAKAGKHGMRLLINDFSRYSRYASSPVAVNDLLPGDLVRLQRIGILKIHFTPQRMWAALRVLGLFQIIPLVTKLIFGVICDVVRRISGQGT